MRRTSACFAVLLCCLITASTALAADPLPTNKKFSLAYDRLSESMAKGRPVKWQVSIRPAAGGEGVAGAMASLMSQREFSGLIQCFLEGGGWLSASFEEDGQQVAAVEQLAQNGNVGLRVGEDWINLGEPASQGVAMLMLDAFGQSLVEFDYGGMRKVEMPIVSEINKRAMHLWELASPWSDDNNYLQVSKGSTSHGTSYNVDTEGLRSILSEWADGFTVEALSLGVPGTDVSVGVTQEMLDGFVQRLKTLSTTAEMSKNFKMNMAFGEGDMLASTRGSGTIRTPEGSKGVSYSYSASQSSTRITQKHRIDYQPKGADTLVMSMDSMTSSNNKTSGETRLEVSANGLFDGKPYTIEINSSMQNEYAAQSQELTEQIGGTIHGVLTYDGKTVLDVQITRTGTARSHAVQNALKIEEAYDTVIQNGEGTIFAGVIDMVFEVQSTQEDPPMLDTAQRIDGMDFMEIEALRSGLEGMLMSAKDTLANMFPGKATQRSQGR